MENLHHKPIKTFILDGIIKNDSAIGRLRYEFIDMKIEEMREIGYVPRLDINPNFTIQYNVEKDYFEFKLTVYGTHIGKRRAKWISGVDGTTLIPILRNKSKELSQDQESPSNQK
ncbi:hypothetical protein UFOVP222_54 [uncultured Caudovirales phage]|uniref:Uncharacterized protein n=1 Tax=uncultured Caudovirales phage TaxID=2100421 RepID=A0A6J7WNG8_9CAUD|nr:hypothetical protein UFOVP108_49 [uncultured Caudovirales phage]CAB5219317.1 hypothetical protein UFOVP222_54 [uncultured Caudovirales phage]